MTALDVEYFDWVGCVCIEDIDIVFSVIDEKEVIAYGLNMLYFVSFNPMDVRWRSILSVQVLEIPHLLQVGLSHDFIGILSRLLDSGQNFDAFDIKSRARFR